MASARSFAVPAQASVTTRILSPWLGNSCAHRHLLIRWKAPILHCSAPWTRSRGGSRPCGTNPLRQDDRGAVAAPQEERLVGHDGRCALIRRPVSPIVLVGLEAGIVAAGD